MPRLSALLLLCAVALVTSCSVPCDPEAAPAHCDGNTLVGCVDGVGGGIWEGLYITSGREPCPGVCIESGEGVATCVDAPGTPCTPGVDRDRCHGTDRMHCDEVLLRPTGAGTATVWQRQACGGGTSCVEASDGALCAQAALTPCPDGIAEGQRGCLGSRLATCVRLADGTRIVDKVDDCGLGNTCVGGSDGARCAPADQASDP